MMGFEHGFVDYKLEETWARRREARLIEEVSKQLRGLHISPKTARELKCYINAATWPPETAPVAPVVKMKVPNKGRKFR